MASLLFSGGQVHDHETQRSFNIQDNELYVTDDDATEDDSNGHDNGWVGSPPVGLDAYTVNANPKQNIPATPYAGVYRSVFTKTGPPDPVVLQCLSHVNCNYLSTNGSAPTLYELKKHAQSLLVLIKSLTVNTEFASLDNAPEDLLDLGTFTENQSFDFLNNLKVPYETDEPHHHLPLTSLMNIVESRQQVDGQHRDICPMKIAPNPPKNGHKLPYATHESLIKHANDMLERLDHEYSAKGGLLSIFPTEMEKEEREKAEKTLLGQLILWVQNLTRRVHNLERLYANALDVLAKEAVVPSQILSESGVQGRLGHEIAYPQDKFVLVNAGEDVWQYLNTEFERKEVVDTEVDAHYRSFGTSGEALWEQRGGTEFAKGITAIDVYTRYYRLRNSPLKTVFVIPAYDSHPGTKVTREIEAQPTVVSVVKPVWPERASILEMKHRSDIEDLQRIKSEAEWKDSKIEHLTDETKFFAAEVEKLQGTLSIKTKELDAAVAILNTPVNEGRKRNWMELGKVNTARDHAAKVQWEYEKKKEEVENHLADLRHRAEEMEKAQIQQQKDFESSAAKQEAHSKAQRQRLTNLDLDIARAASELQAKLKQVWVTQITETQTLIDFLDSRGQQHDIAAEKISGDIHEHAGRVAKDLVEKALQGAKIDVQAGQTISKLPPSKNEPQQQEAQLRSAPVGSGELDQGHHASTLHTLPSNQELSEMLGQILVLGPRGTTQSTSPKGKGEPQGTPDIPKPQPLASPPAPRRVIVPEPKPSRDVSSGSGVGPEDSDPSFAKRNVHFEETVDKDEGKDDDKDDRDDDDDSDDDENDSDDGDEDEDEDEDGDDDEDGDEDGEDNSDDDEGDGKEDDDRDKKKRKAVEEDKQELPYKKPRLGSTP